MSLQKFGTWLLKDSGKTFTFYCAVTGSITIACLHVVPQTFLLNTYKDIIQLYKNGFSVVVPPTLLNRFYKTIDLLEIKEYDRKQFIPFMVIGFDIYSVGTYFSSYGALIGLPINYTYIDMNFIDKSPIRILDSSVPWETEEGKMLLKSLHLSEKGQMYGIAREIKMRQTLKYYWDILNSSGTCLAMYGVGLYCNEKFNLYVKPRFLRFCMYAVIGTVGLLNYFFIKDACQLYYERKVDEYLIKKNPIFKEGGKDFYISCLNKNIALRTLMGKVGEKNYTPFGNENYFLRQKHLPLIQRKSFFETELEKDTV